MSPSPSRVAPWVLLGVLSGGLAGGLSAAEAIDPPAVRETLARLDLRELKLPAAWEVTRVNRTELFAAAQAKLAAAYPPLKAALVKAGWQLATGAGAEQVSDEYGQGTFTRDGFALSLSLSPEGEQTRLTLMNLGPVDTQTLPVAKGAKSLYASRVTSMWVSPAPVAEVAGECRGALVAAGWQEYVPANTARSENPEMALMTFRRGAAVVSVYIGVAPAQGGKTSIQYSAQLLRAELPWPADVALAEFSDEPAVLHARTQLSFDEALTFYREELKAQGLTMNAALINIGETAASVIYSRFPDEHYLVRLGQQPEGTQIDVESVTSAEIEELARREFPSEEMPAEPAPPADTASADDAPAAPRGLTARAIPLPDDADDVEYDADDEEIRFQSPTAIKKLAKFYRDGLAESGWDEGDIAVVTAQVATFEMTHESGAELSFMMVNTGLGDGTEVTISTDGLGYGESAEPEPGDTAADEADAPAEEMPAEAGDDAAEPLTAEDREGLPTPSDAQGYSQERTPFRRVLTSRSPSSLPRLVEFYRTELTKAGWQEETPDAAPTETAWQSEFSGPEGRLVAKLSRGDEGTEIELAVKNATAAKQAGILPAAGKAKVMFANQGDAPVKVTFGGKPFTVKPGVGTRKPDGPNFDVAPGKYTVQVQVGNRPTVSEKVEVGPDQAWGVMILDGEILALQAY